MEELQKKTELLAKPYWSNHDIKDYLGCGITKALHIRRQANVVHKGLNPFLSNLTKTEAIFKTLGLNFKEEVEKLELLKGENHKHENC